jgi:hypothetical protein
MDDQRSSVHFFANRHAENVSTAAAAAGTIGCPMAPATADERVDDQAV